MTRRLLSLHDLEYQQPLKYCKLWEANSLAAVARAVESAAHRNQVSQGRDAETHNSFGGLLSDEELEPVVGQEVPADKRVGTGSDVGAAGQLPHVCTATAPLQPAIFSAQKHVPAQTQHLSKQITLQDSKHAQLSKVFAPLEVPQRLGQTQHGLTDDADAIASCTDNINCAVRLHTRLLHDAASTVAPAVHQAQYACSDRVPQLVHQQRALAASQMGPCNRPGSHMLRLVEAFGQELESLPRATGKEPQVQHDLLLVYLEAAAARPLQ